MNVETIDFPTTSNIIIPNDCECISDHTQKSHNFCYTDPQNASSLGRKFNCSSVKFLEKLEILDPSKPLLGLSADSVGQDVIFVSAFSDDHFHDALKSYKSIREYNPTQKFIYYGLKLSESCKTDFENDSYLEFRDFNYSTYPSYVENWMEYRFKPLIIAEVLKEFKNVLWIDTHIIFTKPDFIQNVKREYSERINSSTNPLNSSLLFFWDQAFHSNYAVLKKEVLNYFPTTNLEVLKDKYTGEQLGANVFYLIKTEYTMEVMKWWVLCALSSTCMNPPGSRISCSYGYDWYHYFGHCFRYDQSIINLLLMNTFQDRHLYFSKRVSPTFASGRLMSPTFASDR